MQGAIEEGDNEAATGEEEGVGVGRTQESVRPRS